MFHFLLDDFRRHPKRNGMTDILFKL